MNRTAPYSALNPNNDIVISDQSYRDKQGALHAEDDDDLLNFDADDDEELEGENEKHDLDFHSLFEPTYL